MAETTSLAPQPSRIGGLLGEFRQAVDWLLNHRPGEGARVGRTRRLIRRVPGVPRGAIKVETWDGYLILRGTLADPSLRLEIERQVLEFQPRHRLHNFIEIGPFGGEPAG